METDIPEMEQMKVQLADSRGDFVPGLSPLMQALQEVIVELAQSHVPVLLIGEMGTGKKATASRIHDLSSRRGQSFTAVASRGLKVENLPGNGNGDYLAGSGTIYLEEIGDLNLECQELLLRNLHSENAGRPDTSARLICGTARDLQNEVRAGRFREDFYYHISGVSLRLPPLRQRKEDIPLLLDFFTAKYASEFHCALPTVSAETKQLFVQHAWPGNLRELEDAAKALVVLGDGGLAMDGLRSLLARSESPNGERLSLKETAKAASREAEKRLILKVLTRTRWNRRRAAQELQISYKALLYKLKQIGFGELGGAS
jgi:two-component system, NtrC family, response regulator AtoC